MPMRINPGILWPSIFVLCCWPGGEAAETKATVGHQHESFVPICDTANPIQRTVLDPKANHLYWVCENGTAIPLQCPPGRSRFHADSGACEAAAISRNARVETVSSLDAAVAFECPPVGIHRFVIEDSCSDYHMCLNGVHSIRSCANELHFDEELRNCNFIDVVQCRRDWCPSKDPEDDTIITYPSTENCELFLVCSNGQLEEFRCLDGLYWDQTIQNCNVPSKVQCDIEEEETTEQPTVSPITTTEVPPPPLIPTCPDEVGVHTIPHPLNCMQFYLCVGFTQPFLRECPEGLVFDPEYGECNRPNNNVECGQRA